MRNAARITLAGLAVIVVSSAQAQSRQVLQIEVKPRSWLDAGRVVNVGSMQNYMYDTSGISGVGGSRYSNQGLLPDRFSGGRPIMIDIPAPEFLRR